MRSLSRRSSAYFGPIDGTVKFFVVFPEAEAEAGQLRRPGVRDWAVVPVVLLSDEAVRINAGPKNR